MAATPAPAIASRRRPGGRSFAAIVRQWAGAAALLVLLGLAARALWIESFRYRILTVGPSPMAPALPEGRTALLTSVPVGRLLIGDVIEFRHPSALRTPLFLEVGEITRVPGSSGFLLRLESGNRALEPWHAELHGVAWRVELSLDGSVVSRDLVAKIGAATVLAGVAVAGLSWRWNRVRSRAVARTYRTDLW